MPSTEVPLVCLPFAGAGASFFTPWRSFSESGPPIHPLQLPGRERRIAEEPYTDLRLAADALTPDALAVAEGGPVAVFGHCFLGAVLAFEITRRLRAHGADVVHLFISASRTPWTRRPYGAAAMNDDQFLALVQTITGYRHEAFDIPEMRELLVPVLRADFEMDETYTSDDGEVAALDVPITAIYATEDTLVTRDEVAAWEAATSRGFELVPINGGHMYLTGEADQLFELFRSTLARTVPLDKEEDRDALAR